MHAIAITRLVLLLVAEANQGDNTTKTAAYADDLTAAGTVIGLRNWWETLCRLGHKYSYVNEGSKSWLLVKKEVVQKAQSVFKDIPKKRSLHRLSNILVHLMGEKHSSKNTF